MNYYDKFISFLKKHNLYDIDKYNYLINNTTFIDINKYLEFIGCCYTKNEYNYVTKIKLYIPKLEDDVCVMIAIHEYVHGYLMYDRLGKQYTMKASVEVLPMFYEYLYYLENESKELESYRSSTIKNVEKENKFKYILGFTMQDELINGYNYNIYDIDSIVKEKSRILIKQLKNARLKQ